MRDSLKSAISLSLRVCLSNPRLTCNLSGQELSPTHASLRWATADHHYYFELLFLKEERTPPVGFHSHPYFLACQTTIKVLCLFAMPFLELSRVPIDPSNLLKLGVKIYSY